MDGIHKYYVWTGISLCLGDFCLLFLQSEKALFSFFHKRTVYITFTNMPFGRSFFFFYSVSYEQNQTRPYNKLNKCVANVTPQIGLKVAFDLQNFCFQAVKFSERLNTLLKPIPRHCKISFKNSKIELVLLSEQHLNHILNKIFYECSINIFSAVVV